jgi:hypothetical protein
MSVIRSQVPWIGVRAPYQTGHQKTVEITIPPALRH